MPLVMSPHVSAFGEQMFELFEDIIINSCFLHYNSPNFNRLFFFLTLTRQLINITTTTTVNINIPPNIDRIINDRESSFNIKSSLASVDTAGTLPVVSVAR
jgi:hypothetical protein